MNQRRRKKLSHRLFGAILAADPVQVRALLRRGAHPERGDRDGTTPLYLASVQGEAEITRLLLEAGADPDTESRGDGSDGTSLCAAACWGHTETVRALLAHGADPGLREDHGRGWSPLEWADRGAHVETAALLVAAGATPSNPSGPMGPTDLTNEPSEPDD
ncbi:ankyrin repeat domain-containing protein [Streptomyces adustus]|uniref:ankyrin repeat domain-containing protein n=1 Tax=Streptomyces adustus TaxID=1609272 RepID=UPI0035E01A9B